ncbi:MAG: type II toxin-antitoxin system RelE/ParE family toxin [Rudaea sp.]|uniref:type II toxin-antitoxin system RelE/ParE family toxin n=1 Tax=Rudaea sp. TaxID=2136325 RepID=UPI0039E56E25
MSAKLAILLPRAEADIDEAAAYYALEGGQSLESRFLDAFETAVAHIVAHPASGSPRYGVELKLEQLRSWPLRQFPFLIFYLEHSDCIDVWRVLHANRDIAAWLVAAE